MPCSLVEIYRHFRGMCSFHLQSMWWRHHVFPKWYLCTKLDVVTSQKTVIFLATPVGTSNTTGNSLTDGCLCAVNSQVCNILLLDVSHLHMKWKQWKFHTHCIPVDRLYNKLLHIWCSHLLFVEWYSETSWEVYWHFPLQVGRKGSRVECGRLEKNKLIM